MIRKPFLYKISLSRIAGLMKKEFTLILRDKGTIAMLIILPIMLLVVFGFAIRLDPKHLPTTIINYDNSPLTREFVAKLEISGYFKVIDSSNNEAKAKADLASGKTSFVITIPASFTHQYIKGETPQLLVEIDAADPGSSATALGNIEPLMLSAAYEFSRAGLHTVATPARGFELITHRNYNETNRSEFNIVPGLIGVLLTLTMVMLTSTAITSEIESGTMEMLLTTPLLPVEIILGKVIPYIVLGYLQLTSILIFSKLLIKIPFEGSILLLYIAAAPFIIANLMVGMIFSTIAKTPMQAMQLSMFFQLPSMFLSGYVFSFFGMPSWAQIIGYCLPMTYFMRITRGLMLKAAHLQEVIPNIIPLLIIATVLILITSKIFRRTLD